MQDFNVLIQYLASNTQCADFHVEANTISYNGQKIDFTGFDIGKFLNESSNFLQDLPALSAEDIFNVLRIHVEYDRLIRSIKEKQAKEMVDKIVENNPSFNRFHLFNKSDNFGVKHGYVHFVNAQGNHFVLANVTETDFLVAYNQLQNNGQAVSQDALFNLLAQNHESIKLENILQAELRPDTSQSHINHLKNITDRNNSNMENHSNVIGNEEHGIYLNNNEIITAYNDKDGKEVIERHGIENDKEQGLDKDVVLKTETQQLITFEEYSNIILHNEELSPADTKKVRYYEGFLFDVITYKEYLTNDLYEVYENYQNFSKALNTLQETTTVIEDTKVRYAQMESRSNEKVVNLAEAKKQVVGMSRKLVNTNPDFHAGYINAMLYVGVIVLLGISIAVVTILAK